MLSVVNPHFPDGTPIWTKFENKVRIYTRHKNEITSKFPELANLPIPNGTVLDGEMIVTNAQGKPDFEAVIFI